MEYLIRDALLTGTNVLYCDNIKADGHQGGHPHQLRHHGRGGTSQSGGSAVEDGWALLTPDMVNKAVTKMKKDKVPTLAGNKYVAVIHPSVSYDLRSSKDWVRPTSTPPPRSCSTVRSASCMAAGSSRTRRAGVGRRRLQK